MHEENTTRWIGLSAEVEWHAGYRGLERPVAIREGRARLEVTVESASAVGPPHAGRAARRVFIVRDVGGRRLRISVEGEGRTRVEVESG